MKSRITLLIVVALASAGCQTPPPERGVALKPLLDEAKALGVRLEPEPLIPEDENAAVLIHQANQIELPSPRLETNAAMKLVEQGKINELRELLKPYKEPLQLLVQASARPKFGRLANGGSGALSRELSAALLAYAVVSAADGETVTSTEYLAVFHRIASLSVKQGSSVIHLATAADLQNLHAVQAWCLAAAERNHRLGARLAKSIRFEPIQVDWRNAADRDLADIWQTYAEALAAGETHFKEDEIDGANFLKGHLEFIRRTKAKPMSTEEQAKLLDELLPADWKHVDVLESMRRVANRTELVNTLIDLILHREQTGAWPKALAELKNPVPGINEFSYKIDGDGIALWWAGDPIHPAGTSKTEPPQRALRYP